MGEVRWTHEARRWLHEIYTYIARDNPAAAARTVQGIYDKAQVLASFPEVGHRYLGRANRPIRILLYGHYRIAYLVEDASAITILGIFHGALDIERYLS
ncbi:MAG: type II toxin-antitoxin system RelE/ParE family toxin [Acidobacteria bacterium]|nr:type II toxin-antitoxin system RelE/ParE family toxin [Acidobacteriota bacterium]